MNTAIKAYTFCLPSTFVNVEEFSDSLIEQGHSVTIYEDIYDDYGYRTIDPSVNGESIFSEWVYSNSIFANTFFDNACLFFKDIYRKFLKEQRDKGIVHSFEEVVGAFPPEEVAQHRDVYMAAFLRAENIT